MELFLSRLDVLQATQEPENIEHLCLTLNDDPKIDMSVVFCSIQGPDMGFMRRDSIFVCVYI